MLEFKAFPPLLAAISAFLFDLLHSILLCHGLAHHLWDMGGTQHMCMGTLPLLACILHPRE